MLGVISANNINKVTRIDNCLPIELYENRLHLRNKLLLDFRMHNEVVRSEASLAIICEFTPALLVSSTARAVKYTQAIPYNSASGNSQVSVLVNNAWILSAQL